MCVCVWISQLTRYLSWTNNKVKGFRKRKTNNDNTTVDTMHFALYRNCGMNEPHPFLSIRVVWSKESFGSIHPGCRCSHIARTQRIFSTHPSNGSVEDTVNVFDLFRYKCFTVMTFHCHGLQHRVTQNYSRTNYDFLYLSLHPGCNFRAFCAIPKFTENNNNCRIKSSR